MIKEMKILEREDLKKIFDGEMDIDIINDIYFEFLEMYTYYKDIQYREEISKLNKHIKGIDEGIKIYKDRLIPWKVETLTKVDETEYIKNIEQHKKMKRRVIKMKEELNHNYFRKIQGGKNNV